MPNGKLKCPHCQKDFKKSELHDSKCPICHIRLETHGIKVKK
jgi:Zn finger protein HypA/HybF involved in hydrogenase expression